MVGDGEIKTIFTGLGENYRERIGCEILKLVDIEVEWATILDIRDIGAGHGGELNLGDEEGAEDSGVIFTD